MSTRATAAGLVAAPNARPGPPRGDLRGLGTKSASTAASSELMMASSASPPSTTTGVGLDDGPATGADASSCLSRLLARGEDSVEDVSVLEVVLDEVAAPEAVSGAARLRELRVGGGGGPGSEDELEPTEPGRVGRVTPGALVLRLRGAIGKEDGV